MPGGKSGEPRSASNSHRRLTHGRRCYSSHGLEHDGEVGWIARRHIRNRGRRRRKAADFARCPMDQRFASIRDGCIPRTHRRRRGRPDGRRPRGRDRDVEGAMDRRRSEGAGPGTWHLRENDRRRGSQRALRRLGFGADGAAPRPLRAKVRRLDRRPGPRGRHWLLCTARAANATLVR